jgi:hypothetical protein
MLEKVHGWLWVLERSLPGSSGVPKTGAGNLPVQVSSHAKLDPKGFRVR